MKVNINELEKTIEYPIPLTTTSGKIRIKTRNILFEYGLPHASKQVIFNQKNYVEWQIGYDAVIDNLDTLPTTSLAHKKFLAYNGKIKRLYELSALIYYFYNFELITKSQINKILSKLKIIDNFIEDIALIKRMHPIEKNINGISFYESKVEYPLLIHKFNNYEIVTEIMIREKQRAIGTQAMLYLCFPITELKSKTPLIGRCAKTKEVAWFEFNANNFQVLLEMAFIFGMLSRSHHADIVAILNLILEQ